MKISEHRAEYLKANTEGRMKIIAKTYGLSAHQMWKHKQSGKWIISHAGIQTLAAQEGIIVDYAVEYINGGLIVIRATPMTGGKPGQSTFGEASADTTMQKYLVAMAEKRAYDRAVLINVLQGVGGYGADVYGEDEADDFRNDTRPTEAEMGPAASPLPKPPTNKDIPTANPKMLSRAQLKKRMKGDNTLGIDLFARMFDLEKEMWSQSWGNADQEGLAGLVESVENRIYKEG